MRRRPSQVYWFVLAALVACTGLPLLGCDTSTTDRLLGEPVCSELTRGNAPDRPNVVIVVNDSMRRNELGLYGGDATTPHLDAFGREHLLFENAFTQAPWTKPAIATLFTSLYPSQHRVASDPQIWTLSGQRAGDSVTRADIVPDDFVTMAEVFRDAGYRTGAFVSNPWMLERFGFAQGFDVYDDSFASRECSGETVIEAARAWLTRLPSDQPYLLYVHLLDSRRPGRAGFETTPALIREAYREGIEAFDHAFGQLTDGLRSHPRWSETAVIVTSDHGEALYERGYGNHGSGLHDDEAAIPLIARLPGVESDDKQVGCLTGLVDLLPSFCRYLSIDCPAEVAGWSFVADRDQPPSDARRFLTTEGTMKHPSHRSIRNRHYKLVFEPGGPRDGRRKTTPWSLFDVASDPDERVDHAEPSGRTRKTDQVLAALSHQLEASVPAMMAVETQALDIDTELRERLRAIRYGE
ncbi:MAG: sulfatase [Myxococcota bacterium]|jgi:arylsulfatase A-like enzyme|nr:sulfatase [Myxococcota bacterium]